MTLPTDPWKIDTYYLERDNMKPLPRPITVLPSQDIYGGYILLQQQGDNEDTLIEHGMAYARLFSVALNLLTASQRVVNAYPCTSDKHQPNKCPRCELVAAIAKATPILVCDYCGNSRVDPEEPEKSCPDCTDRATP